MPGHPRMLVPATSFAERVVVVDDPRVALELATRLLGDGRLMANLHRGLWGYCGIALGDAAPLTIQSCGIGPQAALVLAELGELGATTVVHVAGARHGGAKFTPGDLFAVRRCGEHELDPRLTGALAQLADGAGEIVSTTLTTAVTGDAVADLETATLASVAHSAGIRLAALRVIGYVPGDGLDHEQMAAATTDAGVLAAGVLASA